MGKPETGEEASWFISPAFLFAETELLLLHKYEQCSVKQQAPAAEDCMVPVATQVPSA